MKRVKITSSELRLLLIVAAIAILLLSWFLGYKNLSNYASRVNEQNAIDSATVANLQAMILRKGEVEKQTEEAYERIDAVIAKYPSELTQEKAIAIVQDIEDMTGVHISAAGFLMNDLIGEVSGTSIATGEGDGTAVADTPSVDANVGFYAILTMNYTSTYDGFKQMLAYVAELPDRANMPNVSAEYDEETGGVIGTISLNMYYLTNTGKEYVEPDIVGIDKGVLDIFGTGSDGGLDLNYDGHVTDTDENAADDTDADANATEDEDNGADAETEDNEENKTNTDNKNNKNNKNQNDEENE